MKTLKALAVITVIMLSVGFGLYFLIYIPEQPRGIVVGVVDTGCSKNQSDRVIRYESFVSQQNFYSVVDLGPYDQVRHGSEVCQLIIESSEDIQLISTKVAGSNFHVSIQGIRAAVRWLVETMEVDVVNLSLGGIPIIDDALLSDFQSYAERGVFIVVAVGNEGEADRFATGAIGWPSDLPWTINVGALSASGNLESYSSFGKTLRRGPSVDFVETISPSGSLGTSFTAPQVSGKIGQLLHELKSAEYVLSYQEVCALLIEISTGYRSNNYTETKGWGIIDLDYFRANTDNLLKRIQNKTYVIGGNHSDMLPRFLGENVSFTWKAFSTKSNFQLSDFTISGDIPATDVELLTLESGNWGHLIRSSFTIPDVWNNTYLDFTFSTNNETEVSQNIEIQGDYSKKILLDNSQSISGANFEYSNLMQFDRFLRKNGYLTKFTQEFIELSTYDVVFLLDFAQEAIDTGNLLYSRFDQSKIVNYQTYTLNGGNLFVLGQVDTDRGVSRMNLLIEPLGAEVTGYPEIPELASPETIHFTKNSLGIQIFRNVSEIDFVGAFVRALGSDSQLIATYQGGQSLRTEGIAVAGTAGNGKFIVFNSLPSFRYPQFPDTVPSNTEDQFLSNILNWFLLSI